MLIQEIDRGKMHPVKYIGVSVQGYMNIGVAQPVFKDYGLYAGFYASSGKGMPK